MSQHKGAKGWTGREPQRKLPVYLGGPAAWIDRKMHKNREENLA